MSRLVEWDSVSRDRWSFRLVDSDAVTQAFELTSLPDFSEPRFAHLAEDKDARPARVAQQQMQMLRQLHSLGSDTALSLRIVKSDRLTLYLVVRQLANGGATSTQASLRRLSSTLMQGTYSFVPLADPQQATDVSWASEVVEIFRAEEEYRGVPYPDGTEGQRFYVPYSWTPADNDMRYICDALMRFPGRAAVEVTLVPTAYLDDERDWMNVNIGLLRESMNGETIRNDSGKVLWRGDKLPALKPAVDNCERLNKQYETSRLFLSSVQVFADGDAQGLADAFVANSVRNEATTQRASRDMKLFARAAEAYKQVDVPADMVSPYWSHRLQGESLPMRAQRLQRLVSLEEAANFFRIPIPNQPGFPGFSLDTGMGARKQGARSSTSKLIMGTYLDETGTSDQASFDVQQLAKHGLIVGVPGSGKTTAMFSMLHQLWDAPEADRVPFIVLEPAKTEYRALKTLPALKDDLLVFTLGDEDTSPFRFNPLEVLPGIRLENHISRLQACFVGAFNMFDPLPLFLEQAIRRTYLEQGWYDDSRGGDPGVVTPTLSDLCRNAEHIVEHSGFDSRMKGDIKASLLERLNSLCRGSKGRMLNCRRSIPMDDLMGRPVVLELDSLNGDEKSLLMMFLLSYVFEYCKIRRRSGSPLRHVLVVEEAHNLVSAQGAASSDRANPKAQTIELFVNMLAEMRALGQGILIADQLPTAIAPQAVKQTNVKVLMRVTARDDREEIGNTMDLNEDQMHQVVNFKTGHAYLYHEGEDRVRLIRMPNFKDDHHVAEPPSDEGLRLLMAGYEMAHRELYLPYEQCASCCAQCDRRTRNQAESFVRHEVIERKGGVYASATEGRAQPLDRQLATLCSLVLLTAKREAARIRERYGVIGTSFGSCVYVHLLNMGERQMADCASRHANKCACDTRRHEYFDKVGKLVPGGE